MGCKPEPLGELVIDKDNGKHFVQKDGKADTSYIRVYNRNGLTPLWFSEEQLTIMAAPWSSSVIGAVPGFRYWDIPDGRQRMSQSENCCGDQQRAFDFYWAIRCGVQQGGILLGVGSTTIAGPATFGTDKNCGVSPHARYGSEYGYPHMYMDADVPFPFYDKQFFGCACNHAIEHMRNPAFTVAEMLRVTRPGGMVCIITPDMAYSARGNIDPTHTVEFAADEFWDMLHSDYPFPEFDVFEFNTLANDFSFNVVLQRRG